jgi:hypothetical protein
MTVGFGTGVAAMVILAHVLGGEDEDDKSADGDDDGDEEGHRLPLLSGGENDGEDVVGGFARQSSGNDTPLKRSYAGQAAEYIQEKASRNEQTKFPWPFAIAVYIDAAMDGLLIGLTLITSERSVWCGGLGVLESPSIEPTIGLNLITNHRLNPNS